MAEGAISFVAADTDTALRDAARVLRRRLCGLALYLCALTLLFASPLLRLGGHALHNQLHSHILLVPWITGYLLYVNGRYPAAVRSSPGSGASFAGLGFTVLVFWLTRRTSVSLNDGLALLTAAYVCFVWVGGFLFLGATWMKAVAFPLAFLIFMVPMPDAAVNWLETNLVLASADAAAFLIKLSGTPLLRDGTVLTLPGITLAVAQECSGIRSSWVLFITSLLAAHLVLSTTWRRVVLVAFVIPLGIVRNGFRILVIGLLCVNVGPHMVDSFIHHRGGPIFFVVSLVPLFFLLFRLRRQEQRREARA